MKKTKTETIGDRIKRLREDRGWSRHDLSREADIHYLSLQSYEVDNRKPNTEYARKLAHVFGVSVDYIIEGKE